MTIYTRRLRSARKMDTKQTTNKGEDCEASREAVSASQNCAQRKQWKANYAMRECHKGAMVGEKATPEQIRLWQSLGLIQ